MSTHAHPHTRERRRLRVGGVRGNELLTSVNAAVLVVLLAVQGVTILSLESMIRIHLFVGVALLGPVALKIATTGYKFARYYMGTREYRAQGPPRTLLRLIAPIFVASTIGLFASGVVLLLNGHSEGGAKGIHVASFWVWVSCLALHVVLNGREVLRNVRSEWLTRARLRVAGAELRATLVLASILGGVMVALALISKITGYEVGD